VRVKAVGRQTALAGIQRLVADAQVSSSRAQALADRATAFLFYFVLGAGMLASTRPDSTARESRQLPACGRVTPKLTADRCVRNPRSRADLLRSSTELASLRMETQLAAPEIQPSAVMDGRRRPFRHANR
jgi:hypothetical protein